MLPHFVCSGDGTGNLVVYIVQTVYVLHHSKHIAICSIDVLTGVTFFFLRLTVCQVVISFFFQRHENWCLLFYLRFSVILFMFVVFKLVVILYGVKAGYFYCGKCSFAAKSSFGVTA